MNPIIASLRRRTRRLAAALERLEGLWSRLESDEGPRGRILTHLLGRALERAEGSGPAPAVVRPLGSEGNSRLEGLTPATRSLWGRSEARGSFALDGFEVLLSLAEPLFDAEPDPFAAPESDWVADFESLLRGGRSGELRALPPGFARGWEELGRRAEESDGHRRLALDMARMNVLKSLTAMALGDRHGEGEGAIGGMLALHVGRTRLEERVVL